MKLLSKILRFYINSSIHVALAVVSFACITYMDFDIYIESNILIFVFFSTIVAYTFVKYIPWIVTNISTLATSLKSIFILALISIVPLIISFSQLDIASMMLVGVLGIFTLLYVLPFLPKAKNLRDVSGLKIFIIALVWSGATVVLPLFSSEIAPSWFEADTLYYISSRFCFVIALIIPFEIRDLKLDSIYLKTFPQILGIKKTKAMGCSLVLVSALLLYNSIDSYSYIWIHIVLVYLILGSRKQNAFYFTALWVESVPILWMLLKYLSI
ncbi:prenyltransferase UbiA [Psychroflexus tropicus]|uniref:prenyltransferase UbiA n=1 Tax=Psychroflexus tropicus TaxID=197345 RepID=UPI00039A8183|nr:prenyltransferase UbiA [Psychroflexus tropicus]